MTDYIIKSYPNGASTNHPKSWVIEGSNDDKQWEVVDEEKDCPYLNGHMFVHSFKLNQKISKPFRYIRMRITDQNWAGYNVLRFNSIEFYGKLIQKK